VTGLGTTNNNGLAYGTWTATAGSTTVGGGTLRVTNNINIISGTAPITLTAGLPYFVTLLPDVPSTVVTATYVGLTALVEDQFHNSVTNGTVVTFATSLGDILFPQRTTISGLAFSGLRSTRVGTAHITATSGTASDIATVVFTPDVPYTITVQVFPLSLVANSGATAAITATISDRYDNPLNGQVLTGSFSIPTMGTITGLGVTNVAGQVFGTWKAGSALGHALLRVSNRHITGTLEVSLIGTAPTTITVQVSPSILIANSNMTGTITATVVDTYGNPLPNVGLSGSTSPPTLGSVGAFDFTDSDGRASSTWTASPGSAVGSGLLRVSYSGAVSNTVAITLIYSTPTTVTLAVNPRTLVARSSATATITATVTDRYYNRVPNVPLSITITPATVGHVSWSGSSNVNGLVTGTWTAGTVPGTGQLQGGSLSITGVTTVTLDPMRTYLPLAMKNFPPIPFGQWVIINTAEDEYTYQPTVTLQLAANVLGDNIESVQLSNDNVHWSNWLAFAPTMIWTLDSTNGLKTVYAKFSGHMGGVSGVASDDIFLFKNGDFSQNLANWNLDPSSKLSVTVSISDPSRLGNPAGLLGNPAYACTSVPIGYASLSQSFIMPKVPSGKQLHLLFSYHVFTYDQQNDPMDDRHDRFEVLTNTFLVMRDMNQSPPYGCPPTTPIHIIGPKDASLVIKGNPGDSINVDFRLYNDWDNQYNTYVYLDDVRLQFQ
jgi:hypothetical protein